MDGNAILTYICAMARGLPLDLMLSVAALSERFNTCRLISIEDVESELPARALRSDEVDELLQALADQGLSIIDAKGTDRLGTAPGPS